MVFDFRVINHCQYEVADKLGNVCDCGEPAPYEVWWDDKAKDKMCVCIEHFKFIYQCEDSKGDDDV